MWKYRFIVLVLLTVMIMLPFIWNGTQVLYALKSSTEHKRKRSNTQPAFDRVLKSQSIDWINYIYYNQKRFLNYSLSAFEGIVAQLDPNAQINLPLF